MNPPPQVPPLINSRPTITYELTRGDLFWNLLTILVRNRVARMAVALCMVVNVFITVRGEFGKHPLTFFVAEVIICFVMFLGLLCVVIAIVAFALAFLSRQRGVIGQHVIEITEEGLRERTEFNDSLHKWTSICRIVSLFGYLYIYVSDHNSYQVPRRYFSPEQIAGFEAELRARARAAAAR